MNRTLRASLEVLQNKIQRSQLKNDMWKRKYIRRGGNLFRCFCLDHSCLFLRFACFSGAKCASGFVLESRPMRYLNFYGEGQELKAF